MDDVAVDLVEYEVDDPDGRWRIAWHPEPEPPSGTQNGASAICTVDGAVVLVSGDGRHWDLPGGRPERGESWSDTLHREVMEEACAEVISAELLGYIRGVVRGDEQRPLVRSLWWAEVRLDPWEPRYEMVHRRLVPAEDLLDEVTIPAALRPIYRRMLIEAAARAP